jgi:hypothetical protein
VQKLPAWTGQPVKANKPVQQTQIPKPAYAHLRSNLTFERVAQKIGTGLRAVMDAEKGMPTTGIVVYTALL